VQVGLREDSPSAARAAKDGFPVLIPAAAAAEADVVVFLVPDEVQAELYRTEIAAQLRDGTALGFAHGFAVAFAQIVPEPGRPCFLAAPKGQGDKLREVFRKGGGLPGLLAVTSESPPGTWELAAAYAKAIGCLRGGGFRTTFREECVTDQFGEQVVLCGGVVELLQAAFATLTSRGYGAENAYFECVHELKLIADLLHEHGIDGMRRRISGTAAYGGLTRGKRIIGAASRAEMERVLDEIENGSFAREFLSRYADDQSGTQPLAAAEAASPLARAGRALRQRLAALGLLE
jgi:ketol-acid reductoisomerase